jgi:hypothetical protein
MVQQGLLKKLPLHINYFKLKKRLPKIKFFGSLFFSVHKTPHFKKEVHVYEASKSFKVHSTTKILYI